MGHDKRVPYSNVSPLVLVNRVNRYIHHKDNNMYLISTNKTNKISS